MVQNFHSDLFTVTIVRHCGLRIKNSEARQPGLQVCRMVGVCVFDRPYQLRRVSNIDEVIIDPHRGAASRRLAEVGLARLGSPEDETCISPVQRVNVDIE